MTKVLLISYYWPPSGGGGVQRWLKMSKYLPDQGIELTVYTPDNGEFPGYDTSLVDEVDSRIKIVKQPIWEPYHLFKKFTGNRSNSYNALINSEKKISWKQKLAVFLRGNFFIPDARCFWIRPSIQFLSGYLKEHPQDVIISTGPPHSMHLIALGIKKRFPATQWIADFRDPWTMIDFYKDLRLTWLADRVHHKQEASVLKWADEIVTISPSCADDLQKLAGRKITVINNGFDEQDFEGEAPLPDRQFSIVHIGSMNKDRNPKLLWQILGEMVKEDENFKQALLIELVGIVDGSIISAIEAQGLKEHLVVTGQQEHKAVIERMRKAQLLLLPINDIPQQKGVMPGKMYEYIGAGRPILAFGRPDSDTAKLLKETSAGILLAYDDAKGLKSTLQLSFNKFQAGELQISSSGFSEYSRKNLALKYSQLIKSMTIK
mgnify:FL=1